MYVEIEGVKGVKGVLKGGLVNSSYTFKHLKTTWLVLLLDLLELLTSQVYVPCLKKSYHPQK